MIANITSMIKSLIQSCLEDGWTCSNLISLGHGEWQANITDGEHVAVGTGENIEEALIAAMVKAHSEQFVGRLFHLGRHRAPEPKEFNLLAELGLIKKPEPIIRRV